jgi:hypothetical protein
VAIELQFGECNGVSFYRLTNSPVLAVQLHSAFDFERRRICRVSGYANEDKPFVI